MILIYILNLLLIKSSKVIHNCDYYVANLDIYDAEPINYEISCPNTKLQIINIINADHIESISLFKDSDVLIMCSDSTDEQIDLIIFDNPNITFQNNCRFKSIKIYGLPIFNQPQNSIVSSNTVFIYNNQFNFPIQAKKVIFSSRNANKLLDTRNDEISTGGNISKYCYYYGIEFLLYRDYYEVDCERKSTKHTYDEISKYFFYFLSNVQFTLLQYTPNLDEKMKEIIINIYSPSKINAFFVDFPNYTSVLSYKDYFNTKELDIWLQIVEYPRNCLWDYKNDYPSGWKEIASDSKWRFSCIDSKAYLHYNEGNEQVKGGIIYLSLATTIAIICVCIIVAILFVISLCFVAKCRYDKLLNGGDDYY